MTLAQLRYAITVANSNSMNEAARNLFISQPSLSSAIRELEEEIGVELFRRTNRGISVTPEGEEFLGYARQVVEQYELIESKYVSKEHTKKKFSVPQAALHLRSKCFRGNGEAVRNGRIRIRRPRNPHLRHHHRRKRLQKRDRHPLPERL